MIRPFVLTLAASAIALVAAFLWHTPTTQTPFDVSLSTAAHDGWPVLAKINGNGKALPPEIVQGGAQIVPPGSARVYSTTLPPLDGGLSFDIAWQELRTGRQYETQFILPPEQLPHLHADDLPLYFTFGAHGAFSVFAPSAARMAFNTRIQTSAARPTAQDYPQVLTLCAARTQDAVPDGDPVAALATNFDVFLNTEVYEGNKTRPPPQSACPDPNR